MRHVIIDWHWKCSNVIGKRVCELKFHEFSNSLSLSLSSTQLHENVLTLSNGTLLLSSFLKNEFSTNYIFEMNDDVDMKI